MPKKEVLEFEGKQIDVSRLEEESFDYILYKDVHSNDYYLAILLNHSFAYYDKLVKVGADDIQEYLDGKISSKRLVDKYR